jgi:hypothetical protein
MAVNCYGGTSRCLACTENKVKRVDSLPPIIISARPRPALFLRDAFSVYNQRRMINAGDANRVVLQTCTKFAMRLKVVWIHAQDHASWFLNPQYPCPRWFAGPERDMVLAIPGGLFSGRAKLGFALSLQFASRLDASRGRMIGIWANTVLGGL